VYKLAPPAEGQTWKETVLFAFRGLDGARPQTALTLDAAGNLYGTTFAGGKSSTCQNGCGTVFKLSPPAAGKTAWKETTLVSFDGANGAYPAGSLIADKAGNLYGTTGGGGASSAACPSGCGTVFKLTPPQSGELSWNETILTSFNTANAANPSGSLIADKSGNLYGTTVFGGNPTYPCPCGTVFKLAPPKSGQTAWRETVLIAFDGNNGAYPVGSLIAGPGGGLYGVTSQGGTAPSCTEEGFDACGTVFEVVP
jgi:uncharacterized repeat protein (TIGR03803 family)